MLDQSFIDELQEKIQLSKEGGFYKQEEIISSPQSPHVTLSSGKKMVNLCANNYLGLANHPDIIKAAQKGLDDYGFGISSVRFICGTFDIHKELEKKVAEYLQKEDAILYPSCFDANGGIFEALFTPEDAIFSDALNHASIIDGCRLCKAKRYRFAHDDMQELEKQLSEETEAKRKIIVTDGVFSMDGTIANLADITSLAKKYNAIVFVDDCHATGFLGEKGRGSHEYCNVMDDVDLISGTFGKALGGGSGGFIAGKKEIIEFLRQKSRPYLFSNAMTPCMVMGAIKALEIAERSDDLRKRLQENSQYFRQKMEEAGFTLLPGTHPIVPVMFYDEKIAFEMSQKLLQQGIYVISFSFPVVPRGKARIRTQMSAAHTTEDLDQVIDAFKKAYNTLTIGAPL